MSPQQTRSGAATPTPTAITCSGDDSIEPGSVNGQHHSSQSILDELTFINPKFKPPVSLQQIVVVTPTIPTSLAPGATGGASFTWTVEIDPAVVTAAKNAGVKQSN